MQATSGKGDRYAYVLSRRWKDAATLAVIGAELGLSHSMGATIVSEMKRDFRKYWAWNRGHYVWKCPSFDKPIAAQRVPRGTLTKVAPRQSKEVPVKYSVADKHAVLTEIFNSPIPFAEWVDQMESPAHTIAAWLREIERLGFTFPTANQKLLQQLRELNTEGM